MTARARYDVRDCFEVPFGFSGGGSMEISESGVFGCRAIAMDVVDVDKMIVFGTLSSETKDWHGTIIDADSTTKALERYTGSVSVMHNTGILPVGKLIETDRKKDKNKIAVKLSKVPLAFETRQLVADGVLRGFSFHFVRGKKELNEDGIPVIKDFDILDITIVPDPSNPDATIDGLRSKGLFDKFMDWWTGKNNSGEEPLKPEGEEMPDASGDRVKVLEDALEKAEKEYKIEIEGYRSKFEETNTKLEVLEKEKYAEGLRMLGSFDPAEVDTLTKHREYLEAHSDLDDFIRSMAEARPDTASIETKTNFIPGEADYDDEIEDHRVAVGVAAVVDEIKEEK